MVDKLDTKEWLDPKPDSVPGEPLTPDFRAKSKPVFKEDGSVEPGQPMSPDFRARSKPIFPENESKIPQPKSTAPTTPSPTK